MNAFSSLSEAALAPALAMPWPWAGVPRQLAALRGHCLVLPVATGVPARSYGQASEDREPEPGSSWCYRTGRAVMAINRQEGRSEWL